MNEPRRGEPQARRATRRDRGPAPDPRTAGYLLVAAIVLCTLVGLGVGLLVGLPVPFTLAGVFLGLGLGFAIVYKRFRDI